MVSQPLCPCCCYLSSIRRIMSLRTRKLLDMLQHHPASFLRNRQFPVPPYHTPDYWMRLHKEMTPEDVHEWGGFDLMGLLQLNYEMVLHYGGYNSVSKTLVEQHQRQDNGVNNMSFAECMDISQLSSTEEAINIYNELQNEIMKIDKPIHTNESVLLLGCGNSKMGEQLLINSFVGPVLQVDISSTMIQLMTQRYQKYLNEASVKRMEFIVDDARGLTALSSDSVGGGVLDKGLIDVLHCSIGKFSDDYNITIAEEETNPIRQIVDSVHRVLQPSRPFIFFSRSEPEYILRRTLGTQHVSSDSRIERHWKEIKVLKLVDLEILLYRFVKADSPGLRRKKDKKQ